MPDDIPTVRPAGMPDDLPVARPSRRSYAPPPPSGFGSFLSWIARTVLVLSLLFNVVLLFLYLPTAGTGASLGEKYYSGDNSASSKVAIVHIDGVIAEGLIDYATNQLRDAARDDDVKAVVVAVNSPGGSVTASDTLYKQIRDLRDGKWEKPTGENTNPKPIVVHMQSVAASGGYYIAVPGQTIFAEPTTITGSIGVYAPILDLHKLADTYGVKMHIIKKGELKASGSMFKEFTPEERLEMDEMLEATYQRFMQIVRDGRGTKLKHGLRDELTVEAKSPDRKGEKYVRRLADGGVFTSEQAKEYGLIDQIGYLEDAVKEAKRLAAISNARVITYNRPYSLSDALLGIQAKRSEATFNLNNLPGATARMWYLTPGYELSGVKLPAELVR